MTAHDAYLARRTWATLSLLILLALLLTGPVASGQSQSPTLNNSALPPWVQMMPQDRPELQDGIYRVYYHTRERLSELAVHFDIWEVKQEDGYAILALDAQTAADLMAQGYRIELDTVKTEHQLLGPPGYPCYRDVYELETDLNQIVADHPNLTELIDYGDSWRKLNNVAPDYGFDLWALKITNEQIEMPKPRFFLMATIHARELTTPETAMYFVEYLLDNYGSDADATWIVDHHEIYVVVVTNPDGRQLAEQGCLQRKNRNTDNGGGSCTLCTTSGINHQGVDLNRNYSYHWGGAGTGVCDQTYQGVSADSEPETCYLTDLVRSIIPDQRPDNDTTPAPDDTTGLLISMHSYSNLVLWPWGWTYDSSPNELQLRTIGRKFAYFNSYKPERSSDLYTTTGDTTDWAYGELGIPAFTFELGETFFQICDDLEQIMDENLGAMLYAAKIPRTPYMTSAGPDALDLAVTPVAVAVGDPVTLTATINDTRYNNSNGSEPVQNIAAAEYYVDVPPWITTTTPISYPLAAADGAFNATVEDVEATVDTGGLSIGRHIVFVRGQDAAGNWGAFSATFLDLITPTIAPTAEFASNSPVELGNPITFTNLTTGTQPMDYRWNFGDGAGTSTESDPQYTFSSVGAFTVTLVATNSVGSDSISHPVTVIYSAPQLSESSWNKQVFVNGALTDALPITVWPSDTIQIADWVSVTFSANVTFALTETWTEHFTLTGWISDTGEVMTTSNTLTWTAENTAPHTWYGLTKTFEVAGGDWARTYVSETLWVQDADPQLSPRRLIFDRGDKCSPVEILDLQDDSPAAAGHAVHFAAIVIGQTPITYTWNFGAEMQTGVGLNAITHTFDSPGGYTVTLVVSNTCPSNHQLSVPVSITTPRYVYLPLVLK